MYNFDNAIKLSALRAYKWEDYAQIKVKYVFIMFLYLIGHGHIIYKLILRYSDIYSKEEMLPIILSRVVKNSMYSGFHRWH